MLAIRAADDFSKNFVQHGFRPECLDICDPMSRTEGNLKDANAGRAHRVL